MAHSHEIDAGWVWAYCANRRRVAIRLTAPLDRTSLFETHGLPSDVLVTGADAGISKHITHEMAVPQTFVFWTAARVSRTGPESRPQNTSLYVGLSMISHGILWTVGGDLERRHLLSAEERRHLFGVPVDCDALARLYTFDPADLLAHTSPVGREHIAFSGDFLWDRPAAIPAGRRELTLGRRARGAA